MFEPSHPRDLPSWYGLLAQSRAASVRRAGTDFLVGVGGLGAAAYLGWGSLIALGAWGIGSALGYGLNGKRAKAEMQGVLLAVHALNQDAPAPIHKKLPAAIDRALVEASVDEEAWQNAWQSARPAKRWRVGYFSCIDPEDMQDLMEQSERATPRARAMQDNRQAA